MKSCCKKAHRQGAKATIKKIESEIKNMAKQAKRDRKESIDELVGVAGTLHRQAENNQYFNGHRDSLEKLLIITQRLKKELRK